MVSLYSKGERTLPLPLPSPLRSSQRSGKEVPDLKSLKRERDTFYFSIPVLRSGGRGFVLGFYRNPNLSINLDGHRYGILNSQPQGRR